MIFTVVFGPFNEYTICFISDVWVMNTIVYMSKMGPFTQRKGINSCKEMISRFLQKYKMCLANLIVWLIALIKKAVPCVYQNNISLINVHFSFIQFVFYFLFNSKLKVAKCLIISHCKQASEQLSKQNKTKPCSGVLHYILAQPAI